MEKTSSLGNLAHYNTSSICHKFKPMNVNDCYLKPNRIDIWQFPLDKTWNTASTILDSAELDRANRFHFTRHKRRFTCAHAFQRLILSRYLTNKNPNQIKYIENKYGKPELQHNSDNLQFNLSHSGELGLLAVGQKHPLGVDLEMLSAREYLELANYMFSQHEVSALKNIHASIQPLTFFNIWSQKEAFIKACGMGLSYPTQEFSVPHTFTTKSDVYDAKHNINWQISAFQPNITCCGAICHTKDISSIRYIVLEDEFDLT